MDTCVCVYVCISKSFCSCFVLSRKMTFPPQFIFQIRILPQKEYTVWMTGFLSCSLPKMQEMPLSRSFFSSVEHINSQSSPSPLGWELYSYQLLFPFYKWDYWGSTFIKWQKKNYKNYQELKLSIWSHFSYNDVISIHSKHVYKFVLYPHIFHWY